MYNFDRLSVYRGITGSLFGTASLATSASYALTASFVQDAVFDGYISFPEGLTVTGSTLLSGSGVALQVDGSASVSQNFVVNGNTLFVDAGNNRVGVATGTPVNTLQVGGTVSASSYTSSLVNQVGFLGTSSWAVTASYAANVPDNIVSSSAQINTGSFRGNFNGSLFGTASWANNAITASYVLPAGLPAGTVSQSVQVDITQTTGYTTFSSSLATVDAAQTLRLNAIESRTGSYATTGSNTFRGNQIVTGSVFLSSSTALIGNVSGNLFGTSSWATTASFALNVPQTIVSAAAQINTGSFSGSFTGNLTGTASLATTASYVLPSGLPVGTVSQSVQVDITQTTGYTTFSSSLATVDTAQALRLNAIESRTGSYATTGSNTFVGLQTISGSVFLSSSTALNGNVSGNLFGTSSWTVTASFALNVPQTIVSAAAQINTGSFSGSFIGNLTGTASVATTASYVVPSGLPAGTVSQSVQVDITQTTGYTTFSSSLASVDTLQTSRLNAIEARTGSYAVTGSNTFRGNQIITGSIFLSSSTALNGNVSGNVFGTSSWAVTSSFALNVPQVIISSALQINTGSFSGSFTGTGVFSGSIASPLLLTGSNGTTVDTATLGVSGSVYVLSGSTTITGRGPSTTTPLTVNIPGVTTNATAQANDGVVIDNSSLFVRGRIVVQERYYVGAPLITTPGKVTLLSHNTTTGAGLARVILSSLQNVDIGIITTKDAPANTNDDFLSIRTARAVPLYFGTQNSESMWRLGTDAAFFPTVNNSYNLGSSTNIIASGFFTNVNTSIVSASTAITSSGARFTGLTDTTAANKVLVLNTSTGQIFTTASISTGGGAVSDFPFDGRTNPAIISGSLLVSASAPNTNGLRVSGSVDIRNGIFTLRATDGTPIVIDGNVIHGNNENSIRIRASDSTAGVLFGVSEMIPEATDAFSLGTTDARWTRLVVNQVTSSIVSASTALTASRVQLNGLTDTTATNKVLVLNTSTGQVFTTASVGAGGGTVLTSSFSLAPILVTSSGTDLVSTISNTNYSAGTNTGNVILGFRAIESASFSINSSVAIGRYALASSSEAFNVVAIGDQAGRSPSLAFSSKLSSVYIGDMAGDDIRGQSEFVVAIGYTAAANSFNHNNSISIGNEAGNSMNGASNVAIGTSALRRLTGSNAVGIGIGAGTFNTASTDSIFIGAYAGNNANSVAPLLGNNIIIGRGVTLPLNSANALNIGGVIFGSNLLINTASITPVSSSTNGRIGINLVQPQFTLDVSGSTQANFRSGVLISSSLGLNGITDTTATNKVLVLNTSTGQVFTTASVGTGGGTTSAFPFDGRTTPALISGSLTVSSSANTPGIRVTGSIGVLSGSLTLNANTTTAGTNGIRLRAADGSGVLDLYHDSFFSLIESTNRIIYLSVNGNKIYWNGQAFSPEQDNVAQLGDVGGNRRWNNLYVANIQSSGSIAHTGSIILTGSLTASAISASAFVTFPDGLRVTGSLVQTGSGGITGSGLLINGPQYIRHTSGAVTAFLEADPVGNVVSFGAETFHVVNLSINGSPLYQYGVGAFVPIQAGYAIGTSTNPWASSVFTRVTASIVSASSGITGSLEQFSPNNLHITVGTTAPSSPLVNDLWIDTN